MKNVKQDNEITSTENEKSILARQANNEKLNRKEGKAMTTITDVSAMANVSKATVSRVFSGNAKVKEETKQAVLKAAQMLGYNPEQTHLLLENQTSISAPSITRRGSLGMIVSQMPSSSFGQFYNTIQQYAISQGLQLQLFNSCGNSFQEKSYLSMLVSSGCETIVLIEPSLKESDITEFSSYKSNLVTFGTKGNLTQFSFSYDHAGACTSACNFLMAHKHTDLALIPGTGTNALDYIEGFKHGHNRRSLPFNSHLIIDNIDDGTAAATELCGFLGDFSAVITATDEIAADVMATLRQFGYDIPKDISIISLEGSELAQYTFPRLTAVEMPLTSIAEEIISTCINKNNNNTLKENNFSQGYHSEDTIQSKMLTGKLVVRESVGKFVPANGLDLDNLPKSLHKNL